VISRTLVIVAVDGGLETERTVEYAVGVARARAADLHAVRVAPRGRALWTAPEREERVGARLAALAAWAASEGVPFRVVTLRGEAARAIPAYAQLTGASAMVVGRAYGSSRLWRSVAVASRLSRYSPVPVIVVPPGLATPSRPLARIVAAVDFTVASAVALRTAGDLSRRHGASLTMLHARETARHMVFSGGEAWRLVQRIPADAKAVAARLEWKAAAVGSGHAEPVVVTGDPRRAIVDTAAESAADLIVMGVAPRSWMDDAASGSTLRGVLRRATVPVLVVSVVAGNQAWPDEVSLEADGVESEGGRVIVSPAHRRHTVALPGRSAGRVG
jgi:nucleotide-binding universal stress UspA family protein